MTTEYVRGHVNGDGDVVYHVKSDELIAKGVVMYVCECGTKVLKVVPPVTTIPGGAAECPMCETPNADAKALLSKLTAV
jgi:hypothetical protein